MTLPRPIATRRHSVRKPPIVVVSSKSHVWYIIKGLRYNFFTTLYGSTAWFLPSLVVTPGHTTFTYHVLDWTETIKEQFKSVRRFSRKLGDQSEYE